MINSVEAILTSHIPNLRINNIERFRMGISNDTYKVTIVEADERERNLVLTMYQGEKDVRKLRKELSVRHILKSEVNIPVPNVIAYSDQARGFFPPFIIREYASGRDLHRALESDSLKEPSERKALAIKIGETLALMHGIKLSEFGPLAIDSDFKVDNEVRNIKFVSWQEYVSFLFDETMQGVDQIQDGRLTKRIVELKNLMPEIMAFLEKNRRVLKAVEKPKLCHSDTTLGNFIVDKDVNNWKLSGLIDFEWAIGGDPDMDLVFIENWLFFCSYRKDVKEIIPYFLEGYKKHRDISLEAYEKKRPLYHILRSTSYLNSVFSGKRHYETNPYLDKYVVIHLSIIKRALSGKFDECLMRKNAEDKMN